MSVDPSSTAVVILAGGKGTRLGSRTQSIPKAMLPVEGHPLLAYLVVHHLRAGLQPIVLSVGTHKQVIIDYFSAAAWSQAPIQIAVDDLLIGTAEAFLQALNGLTCDNVLLLQGDTVLDVPLQQLISDHEQSQAVATIVLSRVAGVPNEGAFFVDQQQRVLRSLEASPQHEAGCWLRQDVAWRGSSTGAIVFRRDTLLALPICDTLRTRRYGTSGAASLEQELLPDLIRRGLLRAFDNKDRFFLDIGTPERLADLHTHPGIVSHIYGTATL